MLRIQRSCQQQVVFKLSGRIEAHNATELKKMLESEKQDLPIVLDLIDVTLVDLDAVKFLESCESDNIRLENCPSYIREWIRRERETGESKRERMT